MGKRCTSSVPSSLCSAHPRVPHIRESRVKRGPFPFRAFLLLSVSRFQPCLFKNSPLQILTPNISVLFGGGRASSSTGALCGEQEAAVGVRRVDTQASKSCCFSANDALFLMDGGGICLMWLQVCRWAVLKRGVVYAGKKSGSETGAWPWVPLSAGSCPSSLWDVPAGGSFCCARNLQYHHLNPKLGSGKGVERNLVSGK